MDILVTVKHQKLKITSNYKPIVGGSQKFVRFAFTLDEDWKELTVFAQFTQNGIAYNQYLNDDNCCYLPSEIVEGKCTLMLYGTGGETIGTSNYETLSIDRNILVADAQSTEISQSLYQQLVNIVNNYTMSTDRIQAQIDLKADISALSAETARATAAESSLQNQVSAKASQADVDAIDSRVEALETGSAIAAAIDAAVQAEINELLESGALANLVVEDGSITREKVGSDIEEVLQKAESAMQPNIYDPLGYGSRTVPIDPYSFAQAQDTAVKTAIKQTESYAVTDTAVTNTTSNYTGLNSALGGVLNRAELYTNGMLADYSPINVVITDELPETGAERTFYLVPKESGDGYEKYWYITDENGVPKWDNFGSSSTLVVDALPLVGDPDIDYILASNDSYQYFKYIGSRWCLIAGSNYTIITFPNGISNEDVYFGEGSPESGVDYGKENYLDTLTMGLYVNGSSTPTLLVVNPSDNKDYYILDSNDTWGHFRYFLSAFKRIGADSFSKEEIETIIDDATSPLETRLSTAESAVSNLRTDFNNLANMVKDVTINASGDVLTITYADDSTSTVQIDTGMTIGAVRYNENDDYYIRFYDNNDREIEDLAVYVPGGGGGGGSTSGNAYITRVTPSTVQTIHGDECVITYEFTATDASGDLTGAGTGTLLVNGIAVENGFSVSQGRNTIRIDDYLSVGDNAVKISVSVDTGGETNSVATKTWSVNSINMYFTWQYLDSQINVSAVTDYYTPYGALSKSIYTFIDVNPIGFKPYIVDALPQTTDDDFDPDGNYFLNDDGTYTHYVYDSDNSQYITADGRLFDVTTTTRSGVQQALTIPMQTHGSHAVVRYMTGNVNGVTITASQQVHDMVFAVSGETAPIIATSFNTATMTQYNTVQIPIVVYDPANTSTTVKLYEDNNLVSTWTGVDRTLHYWNYSPTTYGTKVLEIECGETKKTISIEVEELEIATEEVSGYDFRFKASEMATNSAVREWSNTYTPVGSNVPQTVDMTFSPNFDWVNGGLHTEEDENGRLRQYLAVRAGTYIDVNYNLFSQAYDPKQYGKNFKFIFKAVNCRTYDAQVLSCMDNSLNNNGVGLVLTANEGTLSTVNEDVTTYYCKDSYIEFEFNIHPDTEHPYLQIWMDGTPDSTKLYTSEGESMQQTSPVNIRIGSPNCDVYVYMIKAYPTYMTNDNELSNFIMDAPNANEMVDRFERNDVLNESGEVDWQKLARQNPDLHVLLLDMNRMTTGKKDNAVAYSVRHICNKLGQSFSFTVNNVQVTVQGTSSVGYLESAGNMDLNFKNGRTFTSDNVSYTTGAIQYDDGTTSTKGYSMTPNSIPVDYLNVKVNVASSENANNACIADWYNTYQPWKSPAKKKNPKARDTMEFVPAVVFIRDRSGNLFKGETSSYHLYGICDIGNSKKNTKVFHDTTNPTACCVEVANNTSLPCLMSTKTYTWNSDNEATIMELDPESGEMKEQKVFEFRYEGDMVDKAMSAWDRFVSFMYDYNPNLATNEPLSQSVTFGNYTFKGSGTYDTSAYDSEDYSVVYLYGYGLPADYGYNASDYVTDTTDGATCYYYINYSNNNIYSSNGTAWVSVGTLTWTADQGNVLAGTTVGTYAGTYTTDSFNYRMAYILEHCEEYMIMDPVIYHFIFIESFLMTDNVAKNTFWSSDDLVHWEPSKDYDNDRVLSL